MKQTQSQILTIRGHRVMLDADLADLYGVTTKTLNQAVKRNLRRFPKDFAFQLNGLERMRLRSQLIVSTPQAPRPNEEPLNQSHFMAGSRRHSSTRAQPWVFTDHGALMAANVLQTKQAIQVSVHVVRASVYLKQMVRANKDLSKLLDELERRVSHYDKAITTIVQAIRALATPPEFKPTRRIGFISNE